MYTTPAAGKHESSFQLPVVVMRYQQLDRQPDPVVYLAGGPGASARLDGDNIEHYWVKWFKEKAAMKRDVVLFDQRGNGLGKPALGCPEYRGLSASFLSAPGTPEENARNFREVTERCHARLVQEGAPLAELGTEYSAQDVNDLMQLLGYGQWNLLGVSYGTRLALEIQSRYPDKVRSLALDSVYPPSEHLFREWPSLLNSSIQRIFQSCDSSDRCQLENGDIRGRFGQLLEQLRAQPLTIPVAGLQLGELKTLRLNDEILLALLFDTQYISHNLAGLPNMIRYLQEGKSDLAMGYIKTYLRHQFDDSFHEPVFWSVECHDNPVISHEEMEARLDEFSKLRYYLPYDYNVCDVWNTGQHLTHDSSAHPLRQTPALVFGGEDDPITPKEWAVKVAKEQFAENRAYLFTFSGIAHSVLDSEPCASALFVNFLNQPDERPSADCRYDDPPP